MSRFIPSFHFENPESKLTPAWCMQAVNYCVYNSDNRNLLHKKKLDEIESYAIGEFSLKPFMRMFKSLKKAIDSNANAVNNDGTMNDVIMSSVDSTGIDWTCLPLIPTKLNSAISVVQKIPVEVTCKASDALAMKKKKEDITFLKNKPKIEQELQPIADDLSLGDVNIGETKHSSIKYSDSSPFGLDLTNPDEESIFSKLIYSLAVETGFEQALQRVYDMKKAYLVRGNEISDHYYYGVSAHRAYNSSVTGLPDIDYIFPGNISCPDSKLKDFADTPHRIINHNLTIMEMFNYFSDEIGSKEKLYEIINGDKSGYCACNNRPSIDQKNWGSAKINVRYIEIRTVDWVGVIEKENSKMGAKMFTSDPEKASYKIWGQNTIGFWWLANTEYVFGIHKLPFAYRSKGSESYQNFSTNIFRSQKKSAVELSIGENKKAQIAEIKLQHAIIKAMPKGKYFDLRFLRNAYEGLKEGDVKYTLQKLIDLLFEHNIFIGDTQGFDGKNDGQIKPFVDLPGGLSLTEVEGHLTVIARADQNISNYTGINQPLTGQSANPEGLVGLQKLLINSSLNALYYCNEAINHQYKSLFNLWGSYIEQAIEAGGKTRDAIMDMIGEDSTQTIDDLNEIPLHRLTIEVGVGQREEERQKYEEQLAFLKQQKVISVADEYMLSAVSNSKERIALLAIKEKKFMKEQEKIRQEQFNNQQQLMQQQGQNLVQAEQTKTQGKIQETYAKGDVESRLKQLSNQLGLNDRQMDAILKRALQNDRIQGQIEKSLKTIEAKKQADNESPLL